MQEPLSYQCSITFVHPMTLMNTVEVFSYLLTLKSHSSIPPNNSMFIYFSYDNEQWDAIKYQ